MAFIIAKVQEQKAVK